MFDFVCRLQEVLKEYDEVVSGIPENVLPLMKPFTNRVDETIKPGLTMLNWTSLNVQSCEYLNILKDRKVEIFFQSFGFVYIQ